MNTLAQNWSGGGPGPWMLFFPLMWALVVVCAVTLLRRTVWRGRGGARRLDAATGPYAEKSPIAVLGRRFAAGEIDEEEYWQRVSVLEEHFGGVAKERAA
ncbi:SHOCT domain-containing protein [Streptomyces varsoviensis]|uniref:Membrane protein n=1 Tax=Streptomyces varsoviensis TaxID=67373 RepID=A0ABR5J5R8_9ACTN|nr:SHOCT domain-containing protein [Streptomyces varsoviensis]KOG88759.1 membrane protein [Streptomyces varsoviensis]